MRPTFRRLIAVFSLAALLSVTLVDVHGQAPAKPQPKPAAPAVQKPAATQPATPAPPAAAASDGMTNGDVLQMVNAKLAEDIVVNAIEAAPKRAFDLSPMGLVTLKSAGVSDEIIRVMQGKPRASAPAAQPAVLSTPITGAGTSRDDAAPQPIATEQQKGNAVGRLFGGVGRAIRVTDRDDADNATGAATNTGNKVKDLKNGEPGVIRTSLEPNVAITRVREFLESKNLRTEVSGETVKTDWGTPEKCPGLTVAQCQARADVQVRAGTGSTTVSIWVLERRRNRGTNDWGDRGAIGERTEKLAAELEALLIRP